MLREWKLVGPCAIAGLQSLNQMLAIPILYE